MVTINKLKNHFSEEFRSYFRMFHWVLLSLVFYAEAITLANLDIFPQIQVISWKLGHETVAAFLGYWIDRSAFRQSRVTMDSSPLVQIRRAIIIGTAMLGVSMGL